MPRSQRRYSETDIYHITTRGAGQRRLFEDNEDKGHFVNTLRNACLKYEVMILAWCLMDNHYHLLLKGDLKDISQTMRATNTSLAHWYNGKYGHVGPVLQDRFHSKPVETESYFLDVIRYIHLNPCELPNIDYRNYAWSSYRQYIDESVEGICETSIVFDAFNGKNQFEEFHNIGSDRIAIVDLFPTRPYLSDTEVKDFAAQAFGSDFADKISQMDKEERKLALNRLYYMGASIRQIGRLTGIGRGIIQRAVK